MTRIFFLAALVLTGSVTSVRPDNANPSLAETMEYIQVKVNTKDVFKSQGVNGVGNKGVSTEKYRVEFYDENDPMDGTLFLGDVKRVRIVVKLSTTADSYTLATGQQVFSTGEQCFKCLAVHLDPDGVTVEKLDKPSKFDYATFDQAVYAVRLRTTDGIKKAEWYVAMLNGGGFGKAGAPIDEFRVLVADEKTAKAVRKAFQHLIRESGGKVSRPNVSVRTKVFEEDDTAPATPATPKVVAEPPAVGGLPQEKFAPRDRARKQAEKDLVDAEAQLPAAVRQDAENREWNAARKAKLQKDHFEVSAKGDEAIRKKETAKASAIFAASLLLARELANEHEWSKDTGNADRVRLRIAEVRKRLIDLQD